MRLYILFCLFFVTSFVSATNISVGDAQTVILNSENIISELSEQGFNVAYPRDILIEAKVIFEQAKYAEVLRDSSIASSDSQKLKAKSALQLVNWKDISFGDVLEYTDRIVQYKTDSYDVFDSINVLVKTGEDYSSRGANVSLSAELVGLANESFYAGRISESYEYLEQARVELENEMEQISSLNVLGRNAKNFFVRYIYWIIFFILFLCVGVYFSEKKVRRKLLKNKISRMEKERVVLKKLIEKTQKERYVENNLSELVFNIRNNKYQNRLEEIKRDIPVLEKKLKSL